MSAFQLEIRGCWPESLSRIFWRQRDFVWSLCLESFADNCVACTQRAMSASERETIGLFWVYYRIFQKEYGVFWRELCGTCTERRRALYRCQSQKHTLPHPEAHTCTCIHMSCVVCVCRYIYVHTFIYVCIHICMYKYVKWDAQNTQRNCGMSACEVEAHAARSWATHTHMYIYIHHEQYVYANTYM